MTSPISFAASRRLEKGFRVGDFVLFGANHIKVRAPYADGKTIRSRVRSMGKVAAITPTGLLRVVCNGREIALTARESLEASKMTEAMLQRRAACLPGWE